MFPKYFSFSLRYCCNWLTFSMYTWRYSNADILKKLTFNAKKRIRNPIRKSLGSPFGLFSFIFFLWIFAPFPFQVHHSVSQNRTRAASRAFPWAPAPQKSRVKSKCLIAAYLYCRNWLLKVRRGGQIWKLSVQPCEIPFSKGNLSSLSAPRWERWMQLSELFAHICDSTLQLVPNA